jgi:putative phosphoribosyl transferase
MSRIFRDRADAGRRLARALEVLRSESPIVLGLPRGGVCVALEVARALDAPLDVWVVRKLGAPIHEELGMGAVAEGGEVFVDPEIVDSVGASAADVQRVIAKKSAEVDERRRLYRGERPPPAVTGRTVVLVDDGIATGGTARAALRAIRKKNPARLVFAAPVGSSETVRSLEEEADQVVCLAPRDDLVAVGLWYDDFRAVTDDTVLEILRDAWKLEVHEEACKIELVDAVLNGDLLLPEHPRGVVLFAHGSGSGRASPRNRVVAAAIQRAGLAVLLFDLLSPAEMAIDAIDHRLRFDIPFLARRLYGATTWAKQQPVLEGLPIGYFGASTGAAAALVAASERKDVGAIVSRGGRIDLARRVLHRVRAATLLVVGGEDREILELHHELYDRISGRKRLEIIEGATHLFEEQGALDRVSELSAQWFTQELGARGDSAHSIRDEDGNEDLVRCVDCGVLLSPATDRAYAISAEDFLCFSCAERRGGEYDEDEDRWVTAPELAEEPVREKARRYVRRSVS